MAGKTTESAFQEAVSQARTEMRDSIDRMYDASIDTFGVPIGLAVFDRRVLYPIDMVVDGVKRESGEDFDAGRVNELAERGWFSLLVSDYTGESIIGVPQYVLARIGLFLKLERRGYHDAELRAFADFEDGMVENLYTADELAYEDDDLKLLLAFYRDHALMLENTLRVLDEPGWRPDEGAYQLDANRDAVATELKGIHNALIRFERFAANGIPEPQQRNVGRAAFRIRYMNEFVRITSMQDERQQFEAGYSFFIEFDYRSRKFPQDEFVAPGAIDWEATWRRPWAAEADPEIIRLPGLVIEAGEPRLTGSPSPNRYQELWQEYSLDAFFTARAKLRDQTVCLHCFSALPQPTNPKRRYCSETCRGNARQKRYRERHPMRDLDNKRRYYSSLPDNLRKR